MYNTTRTVAIKHVKLTFSPEFLCDSCMYTISLGDEERAYVVLCWVLIVSEDLDLPSPGCWRMHLKNGILGQETGVLTSQSAFT